MKIIVAPQAFKGSISALDVSKAMRTGIHKILPESSIHLVPVADGGDGTLETLVEGSGGAVMTCSATDPLGGQITAQWGAMGDGFTAIIEMARMSGLALVPTSQRNPLKTTTYGLGEAIKAALDSGFRRFIIGIGGSATNDAGVGMAQALGAAVVDKDGKALEWGGASLKGLAKIDLTNMDARIKDSEFLVACDVSNPLTGPEGASAIYGPQKGATPEMVVLLDDALSKFASVVSAQLGIDIADLPGSGAAGGLGGGIIAFLGGDLRRGVDIVLETVGLDKAIEGADLVVTGEGCLDYQTVYSKAPIGVAAMAEARNIPVIAISGSLGRGYETVHDYGICAATAITSSPMTLEEASQSAYELVTRATEEAFRLMVVGSRTIDPGLTDLTNL